jgi:hypothetical protein
MNTDFRMWFTGIHQRAHMASQLRAEGRLLQAENILREAIDRAALGPRGPKLDQLIGWLREQLAIVLIEQGKYCEGYSEYAYLRAYKPLAAHPPWHGEPLAGKTLLVCLELGYGDMFQHMRLVPLVRARNPLARIMLLVRPEMVELCKSLSGVDRVVTSEDTFSDPDYYSPIATGLTSTLGIVPDSLLDTVPQCPYLAAPHHLVAKWARSMPPAKRRIGICWASERADYKSTSLNDWSPLVRSGAQFVSLQVGRDFDAPPPGMELVRTGGMKQSWADTAAVITQCDLVISVDTGVAHLAGALGKPVWMLRAIGGWPCAPHVSFWYPSMRIFQQTVQGPWGGVIDCVAAALER